ncbi:hypothetical protein [Acinetobacter higginsii]|uniref:hypothetical protein n=1 Tax=Acinetobacter higginsii TaxID=70347 RepID=UPI001F613099|nr:hypothetical protein [Acinetobacter higginsii]MCI3879564.1 hypothetical protein [Acinetobacter higginsii]
MQESAIPWFIKFLPKAIPWAAKIFPAVVGAVLALILSGDIDKDGKLQISLRTIGLLTAAITISIYGGATFIEYHGLADKSLMMHGTIMFFFAVFGLLLISIVYQSIALLRGKPLSEIIAEIKSAIVAILNGKSGG